MVYCPLCWDPPTLLFDSEEQKAFSLDVQAFYFDPCTGNQESLDPPDWNEKGEWTPPFPPECHDWILVVLKT